MVATGLLWNDSADDHDAHGMKSLLINFAYLSFDSLRTDHQVVQNLTTPVLFILLSYYQEFRFFCTLMSQIVATIVVR